MFDKTARIYDAVYGFKDYPAEAKRVAELIRERKPDAQTLLDIACGTGMHIQSWIGDFECAGVDLDDTMLAIARERCPGAEFAHADMTDFDLGRTFDAVVCLFSSIGYAQTIDRLGRTASAMVRHLAPGGTLIIEPWLTPESFQDGHLSMDTVDQPDLKVARIGRTQRDGRASHIHFDYLVGTPKGAEHVQELHTLGLFTDEEYRAAFAGAGVTLERLVDEGLPNRGMYAGTRPLRP